jgi:hypothetical protein
MIVGKPNPFKLINNTKVIILVKLYYMGSSQPKEVQVL